MECPRLDGMLETWCDVGDLVGCPRLGGMFSETWWDVRDLVGC